MKKTGIILTSALAASMLISSCSTGDVNESQQSVISEQTTQVLGETRALESSIETASETLPSDMVHDEIDTAAFFADHVNTYYMSSGAGAWGASLTINADGTFDYDFHDSDADKCSVCKAHGTFGEVWQEDEYTYKVEIEDIVFDYTLGSTWTETVDGVTVTYEAVEPGDIAKYDVLTFFETGINTADLPQEYIDAYTQPRALTNADVPAQFPATGIYNSMSGRAFIFE